MAPDHPEVFELRHRHAVDIDWLEDILAGLVHRQASPWAVLRVCFSDDPAKLPQRTKYERLFTAAGAGQMNMVDFFEDVSHGKLDLGGSKVFGWYRLAAKRADYVGNAYPQPAGKVNRDGLANLARAAALADGVDLTAFAGVVVTAYGSTDLCGWVGGMQALCDQNSLEPSLLGQEMGHGYGLDHARVNGSTADYMDPWDVMSTAAWPTYEAPDAAFTHLGPGLNAWCMRSRGWLDESRVWSGSSTGFDETIELRPLHHRRRAGHLAAEVGPYLVELRVRERWDAAIPRACVLVHRFDANRSYLMPGTTGVWDLGPGERFRDGDPNDVHSPWYEVEVLTIDEADRTATVRLRHHVPHRLPVLVGEVLGGIAADGGGYLILGGKVIKVPPRGPLARILSDVAAVLQVEDTADVSAAVSLRRALLQRVVGSALEAHTALEVVSTAPPGYAARAEE